MSFLARARARVLNLTSGLRNNLKNVRASNVKSAFKGAFTGNLKGGAKRINLTFPVIGGAKTGVSLIGKGITGGKSLLQRAMGNPLGVAGVKAGLKAYGGRVFGRALGFGLATETFRYGLSKGSNKPFNPIPDVGLIISTAINPISTIAGYLAGTGERAGGSVLDVARETISKPSIKDYYPEVFPNFESSPTTVFNLPETVSAQTPSYGSSFSPSVSVGGGGIDPSILALLLGGVGLGGYALGRRKKKKKKKKKSSKKKRKARQKYISNEYYF